LSGRTRRRIAAFWDWWSANRGAITSAIDNGTIGQWIAALTGVVHAIDDGLAWELMPGTDSTHALVVTAEGKGELIEIAEEWRSSAPPVDATWEYHGSRPRGPLDAMTIGGLSFGLADVRARWTVDLGRERLDVTLWHPTWTAANPGQLALFSGLFLDRLLGEVDKQRWIGAVDAAESAGSGADPSSLKAAVEGLAGTATRQKWLTVARRSADGRPFLVAYNEALKRIDHPRATWHLVVEMGRDADLATEDTPSWRNDDIVTRLEERQAPLAGVVTDADRRFLHFVVNPAEDAIIAAREWASQIPRARVEAHADPGWRFREAFVEG